MKKAIKSFEIIKKMYIYFVEKYRDLEPKLMICEKEDFDNVEKHLEALEIIKKFGLEIRITEKNAFVTSNTIKGIFNAYIYITDKKDEIELLKSLKEVLL